MSVMMPYADGLLDIADWYRQILAEIPAQAQFLQSLPIIAPYKFQILPDDVLPAIG